ncbi:alginate lyase family protein [Streptomyces sp. VRA16 Mangrove soil]|uniref:alginate lyase family protein n=1 Tax=Streptomyces sp. VRA16 Mangrove soil TaxID=2817434 RepID=UPI001A9EC3A7|nr:alginate lyase family protein [Streptomyces sp. VRA16 Mangrove soil]MBO1338085.1 alginate lyase family protein [Streptomyces sp. VRA16 Mangrove soil]
MAAASSPTSPRTRPSPWARRVLLGSLLPVLTIAATACGSSSADHETAGAAHPPNRTAGQPFVHPGVLVGKEQLAAAREHVARKEEPWLSAYKAMSTSKYAASDYTPKAYETVMCPPDTRPGQGCVEEREDAIAAYTQALLWNITRDKAHATKAVEIMDAWSDKVKRHTEGNAGLQTAWAATSWAKAAELMQYTYDGWPDGEELKFQRMLREVYLPVVQPGSADFNGNWDLVMADATMNMAVYLNDQAAFEKAVHHFRTRVPAYFYLSSDGALPVKPEGSGIDTPAELRTYWFGQSTFKDGLAQETCRNFKHASYSLAATSHIAETAWHQGLDLYGEVKDRLAAALEFHSKYQLGAAAPAWLCGGKVQRDMGPDTEVGLAHLRGRLKMNLPQTEKLTREERPEGTDDLFVAWETLTHAQAA